jgi:major membrane immunogen (membrane-anchored lipoprotein)
MRIITSENKLLTCIFEYCKNNGRIKNEGLKYKFHKN